MTVLKSLLFLVLAPGIVAGYVPLALLRNGSQINALVFACVAFPLWSVGAFVLLTSVWNFTIKGRGTPAPIDPPKELVVAGCYRYVRNPMYVGVILILIGHFFWFGFWLLLAYACFFLIAAHLFITLYEEPTLRRRFGASYQDYVQKVPRWIPRFK
jgi:protein-S-isoprenylcysteine O-methyltransferase Ste14